MPTFIYNKAAERFRAEYNAWFAQYMQALEESFTPATPEEREQVDAAIARVRAAQQEIEELMQAFERGREDGGNVE